MSALLALALAASSPADFGGIPNDGQPDNMALQSCIDSSASTGLPCEIPVGVWDVRSRAGDPGIGNPYQWAGLQIVANTHPVAIIGSGPASVLRMVGDGHGADFYLLGTWDARDVRIAGLMLDGSGRTAGFAEQQHLVNLGYGTRRVLIERVVGVHPALADSGGGDVIRLLGGYTPAELVEDVTIRDVVCLGADRSCLGFQRGVHRVTVDNVLAIGTGDQDIDMEATGLITDEERIRDVDIRRFVAIRADGGLSVSLGRGDRISMTDSTVLGGQVFLLSCRDCAIANSSIIAGVGPDPAVGIRRASDRVRITDSLISRAGGGGALVEVYADSDGAPRSMRIEGNYLVQPGAGPAVRLTSVDGFRLDGNMMSAGANGGIAVDVSRGWGRVDGNDFVGGWLYATAVGAPDGPVLWSGNLVRGALYGLVCVDHWTQPLAFLGVVAVGNLSGETPNACPASVMVW